MIGMDWVADTPRPDNQKLIISAVPTDKPAMHDQNNPLLSYWIWNSLPLTSISNPRRAVPTNAATTCRITPAQVVVNYLSVKHDCKQKLRDYYCFVRTSQNRVDCGATFLDEYLLFWTWQTLSKKEVAVDLFICVWHNTGSLSYQWILTL